jgi:hypothetical protein
MDDRKHGVLDFADNCDCCEPSRVARVWLLADKQAQSSDDKKALL